MPGDSTTKFEVDISQLKKGMQEAARQVRLANSEFKAATSGMDSWGKSADGISAKIKQLDSVLGSQNKQLEILQKQYQLVSEEEGATSRGAQELLIRINNQKAAIGKTEAELNKWKKALDEVGNEQEDTAGATDKLKSSISQQENELAGLKKKYADLVAEQKGSSKEAKDTAKAIRDLSGELKESKSSLANAEKAADGLDKSLDDVGESAKTAGDGFTIFKGAVADLVASGIKNIAGGFVEMASNSREYRNEMAKLDTAFQTNGHSAEAARKTYSDFYAVLGDEGQAVEAVNHLSLMTKNEQDLAKWTNIATGVYAQFGASLPIEGLTEAANETAKVGKVTGPLADALNWAGISEDKFNEQLEKCSDEQERQKLIMETLNDTYSDASEHYKETNKDVMEANRAQADLTEAYAQLGAKAEPVVSAIKQGAADMLDKFIELVDGVDFSKVAKGVEDGFSYFIDEVIPKIQDGFKFILDNKDAVVAAFGAMAGGVAAYVAYTNAIKIMEKGWMALTAVQKAVTGAQTVMNAVMSANPIGLVIAAIVALVAAFVILWNKSDKFREFWINLWNKIKESAGKAISAVQKFFADAWKKITETWSEAKKYFSDIWQNIQNTFSVVSQVLGQFFLDAWNAIKNFWAVQNIFAYFTQVWNTIKGIFSVVKSVLSGNFSDAWTAIKNIVNGWAGYFRNIWNNIKSVFSDVASWFGDKFGAAWQAIKDKFAGWGDFWSGLWTQIKNKFSDIGTSIGSAISDAIKSGLNRTLSLIEGVINSGIRMINSAIRFANKLPGVNVGTIGEISLPRLAQGAVTKKGKAYLLEGSGDEAVVPLHNNKKWIRKTAQDMKTMLQKEGAFGGGSGGAGVTNNYNFTQNNNSPKSLSHLEIYRQTRNQLELARGLA